MRRAMGATILTGATMLLITATHRGGSHSFSCGGQAWPRNFQYGLLGRNVPLVPTWSVGTRVGNVAPREASCEPTGGSLS